VKIATWNVNGIRKRQAEVIDWLARETPDVACLQEIKASPQQVPALLFTAAGYHAHWHGSGGYSGVALLLRMSTFAGPIAFVHPPFDMENRIVVAEVGDVVLGSVYVPNGNKDFDAKMTFLRELDAWAAALQAADKHLVLCGDFNVARTARDVHASERRLVTGQLPEERALIESLFTRGLVDVGRLVAPDDDALYTWWAPWRNLRQRNIGWRLDYVAANQALVDPETVTCRSYREVGTSDHGPVIAELRDPVRVTTAP
jgi:exodeoxyribonuclease-3